MIYSVCYLDVCVKKKKNEYNQLFLFLKSYKNELQTVSILRGQTLEITL